MLKVILHWQDNFLSYGNFALGTIEWFIPSRKTPSWLHSSNTGKMYIPHENLWTSSFTSVSTGFPFSREWHTHTTNSLHCHSVQSAAQNRYPVAFMQSLSSTPYPVEGRLLSGVRITDQVRNDKDKNHRSSKDLIQDNGKIYPCARHKRYLRWSLKRWEEGPKGFNSPHWPLELDILEDVAVT